MRKLFKIITSAYLIINLIPTSTHSQVLTQPLTSLYAIPKSIGTTDGKFMMVYVVAATSPSYLKSYNLSIMNDSLIRS